MSMFTSKIEIRPLRHDDFNAAVEIDKQVFKQDRTQYYETRFARALDEKDHLVLSLVAEVDQKVVGFVMSELFTGQYGIPLRAATLDTIGVHPEFQGMGIGRELITAFVIYLRKAGVKQINTLVDWNDWPLIRFFNSNGFEPAKTINLELKID